MSAHRETEVRPRKQIHTMNTQNRLLVDFQKQLDRCRELLPSLPQADPSAPPAPPAASISKQAFGGFLMMAKTEEQVRTFMSANPEAARRFLEDASKIYRIRTPHPQDIQHAADEAEHPFSILGWVGGGAIDMC